MKIDMLICYSTFRILSVTEPGMFFVVSGYRVDGFFS